MEEFDDGDGPALYACGSFQSLQGRPFSAIARWDGREWTEVAGGLSAEVGYAVGHVLQVWDDGRGPALYVGGRFARAGGVTCANVARWDGRRWESLGKGADGSVYSFGVFNDGRGDALYVGGAFDNAGGSSASLIARWDGANWENLGAGLQRFGGRDAVFCMSVFDDGRGSMLYVGGSFPGAGPIRTFVECSTHLLARWDGHNWWPVPDSQLQRWGDVGHIDQLISYDDGNGRALYISGSFRRPGTGYHLIRWDGREWSAPGGGVVGDTYYHADALAVHNEGSGEVLWIGGGTMTVVEDGGNRIRSTVLRWDGHELRSPGAYPLQWVYAFESGSDAFGPALYACGDISHVYPGGLHPEGIVRWIAPRMPLSHSPLRAGEQASFATTCATPGGRVYFTYSTTGLGSFFVPQLNVTLDLDAPHLAGSGIADQDGKAELIRRIPPDAAGRTVYLQAAEQGRKSEVVEAVIE